MSRAIFRNSCLTLGVVSLLGCGSEPSSNERDAGAADATSELASDSEKPSAEMVRVPAGPFMMGCNEAIDTTCLPDEKPYHEVTLSSFDIDRLELTRGAYLECVTSGTCVKPIGGDVFLGDDPVLPVVGLERASAEQYCAWAGKRLPTEAEWEKAARGTDGRIYPWGNEPPDCTRANVVGCGDQIEIGGLHPSGASPYGALDMAGNVSELVVDTYDTDYYAVSPAMDPQNVLGAGTVRRGCNGHDVVYSPRVSHRGEDRSSEDYFVRGTRCVRSVD